MTPAMLILGWERFTMLRFTQPDDASRVLRQSQHFITPDRMRFAPVRLLRELSLGKPFPVAEKDSTAFAGLRGQLEASGWRVLRDGDDGFETVFDAWTKDCLSFSADNGPRNWSGTEPRKDRQFVVPA